jgi:hypothetical protein
MPHDPLVHQEIHIRQIEAHALQRLGQNVTVRDLVRLMLSMGWVPPEEYKEMKG